MGDWADTQSNPLSNLSLTYVNRREFTHNL